ncbi:MAG: family 16 glycosylhydrolase, partial [Gammaproteobacteria bacterium]|nr:family 16 glycosylhydrolase [Gammaproteobacteria bacterium]NNM19818.1 family 16 glycosylhydrolase [Gammaproteobacteria bacterium]
MKIINLITLLVLLAGCAGKPQTDVVWAVNVGGSAYTGVDGTEYVAEQNVAGGTVGTLEKVLGSQDEALYLTYREGDVRVAAPIANGTYDVTLHFVEPAEIAGGERVFDAYVEEQLVIDDIDVMAWRDGKVVSALTVTVPDAVVDDGELNVHFEASAAQPVLSGIVVRIPHDKATDWQLVWSDEFNYSGAPDPDKWSLREWPSRKVNDENQAYTKREKNVRVEGGNLIIEAHKEQFADAEYTSARLHSAGKGEFLYGRIEARALLPAGKGTWPAIWMLPADPFRYATRCEDGEWQGNPDCDAWPNSGEIDILEHVGYQMNHVHGTVHNEAYFWAKWNQRKGRILLDDVAGSFHTYSMEWDSDVIRMYVDDTLYFVYANEGEGWAAWPYDHPFFLIMNVAVGGYWGRAGGGIDESIFPQRMLVDYVR